MKKSVEDMTAEEYEAMKTVAEFKELPTKEETVDGVSSRELANLLNQVLKMHKTTKDTQVMLREMLEKQSSYESTIQGLERSVAQLALSLGQHVEQRIGFLRSEIDADIARLDRRIRNLEKKK